MSIEQGLRGALRREAERHQVNPLLPRSAKRRALLRRGGISLAAISVAASLTAGGFVTAGWLSDSTARSTPATSESDGSHSATRSAAGAPLALLEAEGWRPTYVDEYDSRQGEMTFSNGHREVDFYWRPARYHASYLEDRRADAAAEWDATILGTPAVLIQYEGSTDFTALWTEKDLSMELRGAFPDVDAYKAVAASLNYVPEEEWLAALPDGTVGPTDRDEAVTEMLSDIPLHPKVDVEALKTGGAVRDRYQLGAEVTAAVSCAWIGQWVEATKNDNERRAQAAVDAMATSRGWAILREMKSQGGWSQTVWQYADAMASGDFDMINSNVDFGEEPVKHYEAGLGCEPE